ncbi:MAG: type IV pilus biogenesis complex membrane subunit [Candidatus Syntrophoarchaeum caldarius]|uniref:Type IV pilus biogenesis complex membrane subunit n=1 Tax=Candidatus Syntropharchaeum caldarium TaxID=1838285 RepID=A0A1F2P966_9EURY|nr:MAG: type IV pilus biogenesis complex membrane subunit [Candidatus Syntrophoarchaeum caldarius]
MNLIDKIGYRLFGKWVLRKKLYYIGLQKKLRQSQIHQPFDQYVASAIIYSLISAVIGGILGYLFAPTLLAMIEFYAPILNIHLSGSFRWLAPQRDLLVTLITSTMLFLIFWQVTYRLILFYPTLLLSLRKDEINLILPHAASFMYALSKGGMNLLDVFRSLASHKGIYHAASEEAAQIVRDVDYLGCDLVTALHNASKTSPSERFRSFVENMTSVIESGGDITEYLGKEAKNYQENAVEEQKSFLEMLELIAESYVTLFVAGPIFFIVVIVLMGMMGSVYVNLLYLVIYAVIPIGSIAFIVLLDSISRSVNERRGEIIKTRRRIDVFRDVEEIETDPEDEAELFKAFKWYERLEKPASLLKHPLHAFLEKPVRVLYFSFPLSVILLFFTLRQLESFTPAAIDDYILLALFVALLPFTIVYEARERIVKAIERAVPDFLSSLSSVSGAGLTLKRAIETVLRTDLGVLTSEIRKIKGDMEWGSSTQDALYKFEERLKIGAISRAVTLIVKASEVSGDIREVLSIAAKDAATTERLRENRYSNTVIYLIIIYIAFGVFLGILYVISAVFLPLMPSSESIPLQNAAGSYINAEAYKLLFFHAVLIQGFFSGLIAGKIGEGSLLSGIKHGLIMIAIGYTLFTLFL